MARVAPVQTSEIRPTQQPNQQVKTADPFAMLLETVSTKRINTPEPRRKPDAPESSPRVNAADKPERLQPKPDAKQAPNKSDEMGGAAVCGPQHEKTSADSQNASDGDTTQQTNSTDADAVVAVAVDAAVVAVDPEISIGIEMNTEVQPLETSSSDEAGITPVTGVSTEAGADIETAVPQQQNVQQPVEAVAVAPVTNGEVAVDPVADAPVIAATVKVSASTEAKQNTQTATSTEAGLETAESTEATPQADQQVAKAEAPAETKQPVASNHAEARESAIAEKNEQQAQVKPAQTQEANAHAKENASAKPLEHVPAQSNVENSTPRQQTLPPVIQAMPEPVRALAGSINPVNLRAANEGATNAVQANAGAVGIEIATRAKDGAKRFDIRLDPPELGRVEVRLEVGADGKTSTRLIVERPETLDLLQRDARNLERALQSAGLQTDEGGMQFSLQQQGQNGLADANSDRGFDRRNDFLAAAIEDAEPASVAMDRYAQSIIARGGVDIRI